MTKLTQHVENATPENVNRKGGLVHGDGQKIWGEGEKATYQKRHLVCCYPWQQDRKKHTNKGLLGELQINPTPKKRVPTRRDETRRLA